MAVIAVIALWTVIGCGAVAWLRWSVQREHAYDRLTHGMDSLTLDAPAISLTLGESPADSDWMTQSRGSRRLVRKWIWLPWVAGVVIATIAG